MTVEIVNYQEMIEKLLEKHPEGLGFNEMAEFFTKKKRDRPSRGRVEPHMAKNTLRKYLYYMINDGLVKTEPEKRRWGQQQKFILTDKHNNYKKLKRLIKSETKEYVSFIKRLDKLCDSIKYDNVEVMDKLFRTETSLMYKIKQFYSIPTIVRQVISWNPNWISDRYAIIEILVDLFESYYDVDYALNKYLDKRNDLHKILDDRFNKLIKEYEDKYPDETKTLDDIDIQYLNIFKDRKMSLDMKDNEIFRKKSEDKI
jgi:hypothetical protein